MEFYTYRQHLKRTNAWRKVKALVLNEIENKKKVILWPIINYFIINNIKDKIYETEKYSDRASTLMDALHQIRLEDQVAYVDNYLKLKKKRTSLLLQINI
jgi:hypothetical protein